jgi:ATP-dependent Clp endopeptidase proteolytic subunit ClpP
MVQADIQTYCFGLAASMGAFLLGAGTKGKRYSMPNARIMIHQPLGGASGQAVDIEIQAKEIMYHKANLNGIMARYTGQPIEKVPAGPFGGLNWATADRPDGTGWGSLVLRNSGRTHVVLGAL